MIKIMFVCLGNICRSPMAEFVMTDMLKKRGEEKCFQIASSATSSEEVGNGVHFGTLQKMKEEIIPVFAHTAAQLKHSDYSRFDYFVGMEERNLRAMRHIFGEDKDSKICKLLDFTDDPRDIADPWYTGNFDKTFFDIREGCEAFINFLLKK